MRPKVALDDFACNSEVCDHCPPVNNDVLELIVTCLQFFDEIH